MAELVATRIKIYPTKLRTRCLETVLLSEQGSPLLTDFDGLGPVLRAQDAAVTYGEGGPVRRDSRTMVN